MQKFKYKEGDVVSITSIEVDTGYKTYDLKGYIVRKYLHQNFPCYSVKLFNDPFKKHIIYERWEHDVFLLS